MRKDKERGLRLVCKARMDGLVRRAAVRPLTTLALEVDPLDDIAVRKLVMIDLDPGVEHINKGIGIGTNQAAIRRSIHGIETIEEPERVLGRTLATRAEPPYIDVGGHVQRFGGTARGDGFRAGAKNTGQKQESQ